MNYVTSFNSTIQYAPLPPLYRWRNWDLETSDLLLVTLLVDNRTRIHTHDCISKNFWICHQLLASPQPGSAESNMPRQKGSRVVLISGKDKKLVRTSENSDNWTDRQTDRQTHTHTHTHTHTFPFLNHKCSLYLYSNPIEGKKLLFVFFTRALQVSIIEHHLVYNRSP